MLVELRDRTGAALIVIEHDMPLITSISDTLLALDLGRVVTSGPPDEVINHPTVIEGYLESTPEVIERSGPSGKRKKRAVRGATAPRSGPRRVRRA